MKDKTNAWNVVSTPLNDLRVQRGWKINQIAKAIKVPEATVATWLRGTSYPSDEGIDKLASAFMLPREKMIRLLDKGYIKHN